MAIGFDGMKRGRIVGTKMAGLIGAISGYQTSMTNIGYQIPVERLYLINGTPRENFVPKYLTENSLQTWNVTKKLLKIRKELSAKSTTD